MIPDILIPTIILTLAICVILVLCFICVCKWNELLHLKRDSFQTRFEPRSLDEISSTERRLNTGIADQNYEFSQTRFEPSTPLEEIYVIDIAPNTYRMDSELPPYSEIMTKALERDLNEPPPSYLQSIKSIKSPQHAPPPPPQVQPPSYLQPLNRLKHAPGGRLFLETFNFNRW